MTRRKSPAGFLLLAAVAVLLIWPVYQWAVLPASGQEKEESTYLLYQVSRLQMELLAQGVKEAANEHTAEALESLKVRLYSASFTHNKLAEASGSRLSELRSLQRLSEWITRVQLGERELSEEEAAVLQEMAEHFEPVNASYENLFGEVSGLIPSQIGKLGDADDKLADWLEEELEL
ncbi:hypothetical protein [Paenibacillus gansuensis]|uniref:S-adenosylmethionine decarboxylase n=1 Tax=Paenibacillus gansuensis TaxID=306542 RepID=A0ABW5PBF5_9BACL